jgi:hypothetical protein
MPVIGHPSYDRLVSNDACRLMATAFGTAGALFFERHLQLLMLNGSLSYIAADHHASGGAQQQVHSRRMDAANMVLQPSFILLRSDQRLGSYAKVDADPRKVRRGAAPRLWYQMRAKDGTSTSRLALQPVWRMLHSAQFSHHSTGCRCSSCPC